MKTSDGITAYIAGGLGNQLFILAAAWEQALRLDCPLYLNTSHLRVSGPRLLELENFAHPGIELTSQKPWTSVKFPRNHVYPFPISITALANKVFIEKNQAKFDPRINEVKKGTMLVGYFQSPSYFSSIASDLYQSLLAANLGMKDLNYITSLSQNPCISLHLRRGDYLDLANSESVLASIEYAKRAIATLREMGNSDPIRVFTDSKSQIASELINLGEPFEFVDDSMLTSGLSTIKAMSSGSALIMSNSSFSWWAGWLLEQKSPGSNKVVAPRPWNESGTARADMLPKTWLTLDARP